MRNLMILVLLTGAICGCSGATTPSPTTDTTKQRLPVEVEKGPEDALPKKR